MHIYIYVYDPNFLLNSYYYFVLKMEEECTLESPATIYKVSWRRVPQDLNRR
jgi:hypothetical protein